MQPDVQQLTGEGHELFQPERLVTKLSAQGRNLGRLRIVEVIVTSHNCDRRVGEARNGPKCAQDLQSAGERHAQVQNDGVGFMCLCERQPFVGRQSRPDLVPFEPEHSGKRVGDTDVVIDDKDAGSRSALGSSHGLHCGHEVAYRQVRGRVP